MQPSVLYLCLLPLFILTSLSVWLSSQVISVKEQQQAVMDRLQDECVSLEQELSAAGLEVLITLALFGTAYFSRLMLKLFSSAIILVQWW